MTVQLLFFHITNFFAIVSGTKIRILRDVTYIYGYRNVSNSLQKSEYIFLKKNEENTNPAAKPRQTAYVAKWNGFVVQNEALDLVLFPLASSTSGKRTHICKLIQIKNAHLGKVPQFCEKFTNQCKIYRDYSCSYLKSKRIAQV